MKPFKRLDETTATDGTVLALFEHDGAYLVRVNGVELTSTRRHHSEDTLAEMVCEPLAAQRGARVLIGSLGLGFTLRAALRVLPADSQVIVAEAVEKLIEWNRNPAYPLAGPAMFDPRVDVRNIDVARIFREAPGAFDAIILDMDEGVGALSSAMSAQLDRGTGIHLAAAALKPHGRLAYRTTSDDPKFENTLRYAGLEVAVTRVRAHATSGPWHTLYVAQQKS